MQEYFVRVKIQSYPILSQILQLMFFTYEISVIRNEKIAISNVDKTYGGECNYIE